MLYIIVKYIFWGFGLFEDVLLGLEEKVINIVQKSASQAATNSLQLNSFLWRIEMNLNQMLPGI